MGKFSSICMQMKIGTDKQFQQTVSISKGKKKKVLRQASAENFHREKISTFLISQFFLFLITENFPPQPKHLLLMSQFFVCIQLERVHTKNILLDNLIARQMKKTSSSQTQHCDKINYNTTNLTASYSMIKMQMNIRSIRNLPLNSRCV